MYAQHSSMYPIDPESIDTTAFWSHADKSGGPQSCWLWTGERCPDRQGQYGWFDGHYAHRVAIVLNQGFDILLGEYVRHLVCDNPLCVNPRHLRVSPSVDNKTDMMRDRLIRERFAIGPDLRTVARASIMGFSKFEIADYLGCYAFELEPILEMVRGGYIAAYSGEAKSRDTSMLSYEDRAELEAERQFAKEQLRALKREQREERKAAREAKKSKTTLDPFPEPEVNPAPVWTSGEWTW